jgi:hypothetical protein
VISPNKPSIAGIFLALAVSACAGPMAQREAEHDASAEMSRYCRMGGCGKLRLVHVQKIKDRWLVDFDAPARKYTVLVKDDGNTELSIWDKGGAAIGQ